MQLSNEQMRAVNHGYGEPEFEWVVLPTGRQILPPWLKGSKIWWGGYYRNSPMLQLKTWRYDDPRLKDAMYRMPNMYKQERKGFFVDRHQDGRVHHLSHASPIIRTKLKRFLGIVDREMRYEEYDAWATAERQAGFGGTEWWIRESMEEGAFRDVALRGPWHSSPPSDCVECSSDMGGLTITKDLFLRIVATYHPWHRVAQVTDSRITTLDVVHSDWSVPKQMLPHEHPIWRYDSGLYAESTT